MQPRQSYRGSFVGLLGILLNVLGLLGCRQPSNDAERHDFPGDGGTDAAAADAGSAQQPEQPELVDSGSSSPADEDAEKIKYVMKIIETHRFLLDTILEAQRYGIGCRRLDVWVSKRRLLDAWGQPIRGSCKGVKMVLESQGSDGVWGRDVGSGDLVVSEDELMVH